MSSTFMDGLKSGLPGNTPKGGIFDKIAAKMKDYETEPGRQPQEEGDIEEKHKKEKKEKKDKEKEEKKEKDEDMEKESSFNSIREKLGLEKEASADDPAQAVDGHVSRIRERLGLDKTAAAQDGESSSWKDKVAKAFSS